MSLSESSVFGTKYTNALNDSIVYHGSSLEVKDPKILITKKSKDFGYGFYVTNIENQAKRWALRNLSFGRNAVVTKFYLNVNSSLNIKVFKEVDDEWVDFIANCRSNVPHNYDIVEGPMVDDKVFNFALMYLRGQLPKQIFVEYCKFYYHTHQICFCSDRALKCLKFIESYEVE